METLRPFPDFDGDGEPPVKTSVGTFDEPDKAEKVLSLVRQMTIPELREVNSKLSLLINNGGNNQI